jgi:hypothetical protein
MLAIGSCFLRQKEARRGMAGWRFLRTGPDQKETVRTNNVRGQKEVPDEGPVASILTLCFLPAAQTQHLTHERWLLG